MNDLKYGFSKHLPGVNIDAARERVTTLLATEGFGVLTHIDVAATLKKKIGADFRPYHILGACNPALAHKGLQAEAHLGLLLPCNVVVQQEGDGSTVSFINPMLMHEMVSGSGLGEVAKDADDRLRRVCDAL
jgi:uncharacterized protein (DUF302 family)